MSFLGWYSNRWCIPKEFNDLVPIFPIGLVPSLLPITECRFIDPEDVLAFMGKHVQVETAAFDMITNVSQGLRVIASF